MGIIKYPVRWLAVKLLENDSDAIAKVRAMEGTQSILALASTLRDSLANKIDLDFYFAQCRYQFATDVFNKSIINVGSSDSLSDKIDSVLTHRYLGIPIFLALMWLMFVVVINVGAYPQGWLDTGFSMLGDWCSDVIEDEQLRSSSSTASSAVSVPSFLSFPLSSSCTYSSAFSKIRVIWPVPPSSSTALCVPWGCTASPSFL